MPLMQEAGEVGGGGGQGGARREGGGGVDCNTSSYSVLQPLVVHGGSW